MSMHVPLLLMTILSVIAVDYQIPNIEFEPSGDGYHIYIPDDPYMIKSVNYIMEVNNKCPAIKNHLVEPKNEKWTFKETVHKGDKIKVYLFVEVDRGSLKKYAEIHIGDSGKAEFVKSAKTPNFSNSKEWCLPTETTFLGKKAKCAGDLLFEETFNDGKLNMSVWTSEIRSMLYSQVTEFVAYDNRSENCYIDNGKLVLDATWNKRDEPVKLMERCTSRREKRDIREECEYNRRVPGQLNFAHPAAFSSKIHTKEKVYGKYFRMEIRARMPKGDFLFPYILLQPKSKYSEDVNINQMRIGARGNMYLKSEKTLTQMGGQTLFGEILYWHNPEDCHRIERIVSAETMYADQYHVYAINWQRNKTTFEVDGADFGWIDNSSLKTFNEEDFYIALGLTVGGGYNFPAIRGNFSEIIGKVTRKNVNIFNRSNVYTTWKQPLKVDYIRLFATELI